MCFDLCFCVCVGVEYKGEHRVAIKFVIEQEASNQVFILFRKIEKVLFRN